jgi:hypothetical protein
MKNNFELNRFAIKTIAEALKDYTNTLYMSEAQL